MLFTHLIEDLVFTKTELKVSHVVAGEVAPLHGREQIMSTLQDVTMNPG